MNEIPRPSTLTGTDRSIRSLATDLRAKAAFFASFGVREYWVIAARTRVAWIHREPSPTGYAEVREVQPDQTISPLLVPTLAFRLEDVGQQYD
jgi:Uma2 family endonuclease